MELGRDLFELLNSKQLVGNQTPVIYGAQGLSSQMVASIEAKLGFKMPEDFKYPVLWRKRRSTFATVEPSLTCSMWVA